MDLQEWVEQALAFRHGSVRYTDFDRVREVFLLACSEEGVFFTGFNEAGGKQTLFWGANRIEPLQRWVSQIEGGCLVAFIPPEWRATLAESGLQEFAEYQEFWAWDLTGPDCDPATVEAKDYPRAQEITLKCRGQSRGFAGETLEWIQAWAENCSGEDSVEETGLLGEYAGGTLAGIACVGLYGDPKTLWLREIAVDPERQGQGAGRRLVEKAYAWGRRKGAARAFLMADILNDAAVHIYEKMGFEPGKDTQIDMIRCH
jgi:GNAT superfamily N-acetyltransferase